MQNENLIPNKNEKFIRHVRTPEKFPFLLGGFVGNLDGAMAICHGEKHVTKVDAPVDSLESF